MIVEPARVTVAVCTYLRAGRLGRLLDALVALEAPAGFGVHIVVVDNDPAQSARDVVAGHPAISYATEPKPGISAARNAALREAMGSTYVAFLDDDEEPARDWLATLVAAAITYDADAVAGPTYSRFERAVPRWIERGRFFERLSQPTGTDVPAAGAGNLLLRLDSLQLVEHWFDDRFGLTGGEDTELTSRLVRSGGRLVWCDEAVTYEDVPADRIRAGWVFRRSYRSGNTSGRIELVASGGPVRRARVALNGLARMAFAVPELLVALVVPGRYWSTAVRRALRGAGMTAAAFGGVLTEYSRS